MGNKDTVIHRKGLVFCSSFLNNIESQVLVKLFLKECCRWWSANPIYPIMTLLIDFSCFVVNFVKLRIMCYFIQIMIKRIELLWKCQLESILQLELKNCHKIYWQHWRSQKFDWRWG